MLLCDKQCQFFFLWSLNLSYMCANRRPSLYGYPQSFQPVGSKLLPGCSYFSIQTKFSYLAKKIYPKTIVLKPQKQGWNKTFKEPSRMNTGILYLLTLTPASLKDPHRRPVIANTGCSFSPWKLNTIDLAL